MAQAKSNVVTLDGQPPVDARIPNEAVIDQCEQLLERARTRELQAVAIAGLYHDGSTQRVWARSAVDVRLIGAFSAIWTGTRQTTSTSNSAAAPRSTCCSASIGPRGGLGQRNSGASGGANRFLLLAAQWPALLPIGDPHRDLPVGELDALALEHLADTREHLGAQSPLITGAAS